ncbi:MAG: lytic transglycosylase domain-containing protein [Treponema sp.]|jgi:soluble lytic murein transglycosylase|nr:lytic transglycosylase domain-containing protein [Treponema sp.]
MTRFLFEISLKSPNPLVREAAARRLLDLLFRGASLSVPLQTRLQKEIPALWDKTLGLAAGPESREPALSLFFDPENGLSPEVLSYMLEEFRRRNPGLILPAEEAAINGRLAVSRSSFAEGLQFFRITLEEDRGLFFRYPELLNDLGRCFQYASAGNEGIDLFLDWDKELAGDGAGLLAAGKSGEIRFRLLFFAGRITRQQGQLSRGAELFIRAFPFAPDSLQEDACIWYILDAALRTSPEKAAALTAVWMPRWNDGTYFSDLLDRLAQYLTTNRRWEDLALLLEEMQGRTDSGPSLGQYACIMGMAVFGGFYVPPGREDAGTGGESFFRLAYETGGVSPYYRALSASFLEKSPGLFPGNIPARPPREKPGDQNRELMEFLGGFFEYGAASFALPAILARKDDLSAGELRSLAAALEKAGQYSEAIRLVSFLMEQPGYELNRADLELFYPRPFQKIIEENAREAGLRRELLFALVRTESAFQPEIASRAGALGLAQLMPATAADMAGRIKNRGGPDYTGNSGPDLRDPAVNVHLGAAYLRYLSDRLENPFLAILAYNGGMNRVRRWRNGGQGLPAELFLETIPYSETREYGRKVLAAALIYGYLYYDLKIGPFFSDMLKREL